MKCTLLILGLFLAAFAVDQAVCEVKSCYFCNSFKSLDDCEENQKEISCSGRCYGATCDTCVKGEGKTSNGTMQYLKDCTTKKICEDPLQYCNALGNTDCQSWCCNEDNCNRVTTDHNGVSGTMASLGVVVFMGVLTVIKNTLF